MNTLSIFHVQNQWDALIEIMAASIPPQQQQYAFKILREIAAKCLKNPSHRCYISQHYEIDLDNRQMLRGGFEFLMKLGFERDSTNPNKIRCCDVEHHILEACIYSLDTKIAEIASRKQHLDHIFSPNRIHIHCTHHHIGDISWCHSARIIKYLLNQLDQWRNAVQSDNESQSVLMWKMNRHKSEFIDSLHSVFDRYDYNVTKLLDDFPHLKYNEDGDLFDTAYEFFTESTAKKRCDINECPFFERHHRERGREEHDYQDDDDDLLMDTLSMIHCYFLHSYDTQRFSKEEKQMIMKRTRSTWTMVNDTIEKILRDDINESDSDIDRDDEKMEIEEVDDAAVINMVNSLLRQKSKIAPSRSRFCEIDHDTKANHITLDDSAMISREFGIHKKTLRQILNVYNGDRNSLISNLIDIVYGKDGANIFIWNSIEMDTQEKRAAFQRILHGYFHCTQLNVDNLVKMCRHIIARKRLQIGVEEIAEVLTTNKIDGRMFDKKDSVHYENNGTFTKRFKGSPNCNAQHVRQLYRALNKWKYVEWKEVVVESKEEEKEVEQDDVVEEAKPEHVDVYTVGKRFDFWLRNHSDYLQAKYKDLKEEVLQSPSLSAYFSGINRWNNLVNTVEAMRRTKYALNISSNGNKQYLYRIARGQPLGSKHLCAVKLYSDFNDLCVAFCSILRRGDPLEVAGVANLARYLIETVQCYGSVLGEDSRTCYFRGVRKTFMFNSIVSRYHLPQSTTSLVTCPSVSKSTS